MRFIAFKSFYVKDGDLFSLAPMLAWVRMKDPLGDVFTARVISDEPVTRWGIRGSLHSCAVYNLPPYGHIYLVAPHPDSQVSVDPFGLEWSANHAIALERVTSLRKAALRIIAAHDAGYEQLAAILRWAIAIAWNDLPSARRQALLREQGCQITQALVSYRAPLQAMITKAFGTPGRRRWQIGVVDGPDAPHERQGVIYVGHAWPPLQAAIL